MGLEAYRCVIYVDCGSTYCSQEKSSQEFEYDKVQQHYGDSHTDMDCKCANSVGHFLLSLYCFIAQLVNFFFVVREIPLSARISSLFLLWSNTTYWWIYIFRAYTSSPGFVHKSSVHISRMNQDQCLVGCSTISNLDHYYNNTNVWNFLTLQVPEPSLSQFPVINYSLTCTSGEGNSCSVTLPADTTSYNLPVDAGVRYTITVSALSNGRESQGNPQLNFSTCSVYYLLSHEVIMETWSHFIFVFNYTIVKN